MEEPPLKITVVKSSITGIGWKPHYIPLLKSLVGNVHHLVSHTLSFLKYIFVHELEAHSTFPLEDFINDNFFKEVFLSFLNSYKPGKEKASAKSRRYKELVLKHRDQYSQCCSYKQVDMKYAHQIASYETTKIVTAYLNGVTLQFGNKLRMFLNLLLKKKERIMLLESEMEKNKKNEEETKAAIKEIKEQISKVKLAISSRKVEDVSQDSLSANGLDMIRNFFDSYPTDYKFSKDSFYYDCNANPLKHLKA